MIYYLDSSVLVKRFVREEGSPRVRQLARTARMATSTLAGVEVRSAIARLRREGLLDDAVAQRALQRVELVWSELLTVEPRGKTVVLAGQLVGRHPLRAYDAVHLASALRLSEDAGVAVTFACVDGALTRAAKAEGLRVLGV